MNGRINFKEFEKGQVIIIVALGLVALIAMAALIVDGAMIMSHRRTAQAAADAAALAGAEYLCPHNKDQTLAEAEAQKYVALNNAVVVGSIEFPKSNTIHVEASVETSSFFARIFNETELSANALAEASCTPLSTGSGTLPIVFPWKDKNDPEYGLRVYNDNLTDEENMAAGNYVIVHDSDAQIGVCESDEADVVCSGVVSSSDRGWLNLDGEQPSNSALEGWIDGTKPAPQIGPGYWLSSTVGSKVAAFGAVEVGNLYVVPIYSVECGTGDPEKDCKDIWVDGDIVRTMGSDKGKGTGQPSYRIVGFGLFKVTCVNTKNSDKCDYREYLKTEKGIDLGPGNSVKSLEGYFIKGTIGAGGGEGIDLGLYTVNLER